MGNWRNTENRGGAHSVGAVRLGRGKGKRVSLTSFCISGSDLPLFRKGYIDIFQVLEVEIIINYHI
jgi:hypothetical protein